MLQECGAIQSALVRASNGSDYFTSLSRPECWPPNVAPPQNWDYGWKRCKIRVGRRLLNSAAGALPVMKTARANLSYLVSWGALIESAATSIPQARPAFRLSARRNDKNCEYLKQPTRALIIPGTAEYLTDVVCVRSTRYAEADSGLASSEEWVCEHTAWQTTTKAKRSTHMFAGHSDILACVQKAHPVGGSVWLYPRTSDFRKGYEVTPARTVARPGELPQIAKGVASHYDTKTL